MSNLPALSSNTIETVLVKGDLSGLTSDQRLSYVKAVCDSVGLNPLTKPFEYIQLNGKLTLYAKRDATDQLRKVQKVSITISDRQKIDDVYIVTAKAKNAEGREDESTGAVNVANLKGEQLANAMMKAETKAKRRVTLSICGLGLLDETEVESVLSEEKDVTSKPDPSNGKYKSIPTVKTVSNEPVENNQNAPSLGDFVCTVGRKHKGKKLSEIPKDDLKSYLDWINNQPEPSLALIEFAEKAESFIEEST